jgi:peptidoglycan/xylan/chitin deacetylase (PgdA/CDA1 family)
MTSDNNNTQRNGVFRNAIGAKGALKVFERILFILKRYGFSPKKIDRALKQFADILSIHNCSATFPTPALVVKRHPAIIEKYHAKGIEFAVHGLKHIDYSQLSYDQQMNDLAEAKNIFSEAGIHYSGFRTPYLRRDISLDKAIGDAGLSYSSNQPIIWDAVKMDMLDDGERNSYIKGLEFYNSLSANEWVSLPRIKGGIVQIPVSLPDDEMLLDRIRNNYQEFITRVWRHILDETYQRGELFTLQIHPERIAMCNESLSCILTEARQREPKIWIANLHEIDEWWRKRSETEINILEVIDDRYSVSVKGEADLSILLKNVKTHQIGEPFFEGYYFVDDKDFSFQSSCFPGIGLSEAQFVKWADYLKQQGYLVEQEKPKKKYACRVLGTDIGSWNEVDIVKFIENTNEPLLRLNLWPKRARSALCITGDLDALTLWDFGLRIFGR